MDENEVADECQPDSDDRILESDVPEYAIINDELHYVCHESVSFPSALIENYSTNITKLDLSSNRFDQVGFLRNFTNLRTLVLDRNKIGDTTDWPILGQLTDLSMNYNHVLDLEVFLDRIEVAFPRLGFLSLLGNPACPFLVGADEDIETDYTRYRIYIAYRLRSLRFLDVAPVSDMERKEANRRGMYLRTVRKSSDIGVTQHEDTTNEDDQPKYTPLPSNADLSAVQTTSMFGKCKYIYQGKQSEGNRFIMNGDL